MSIAQTLKATYNKKFCESYVYGGMSIWGMQDQNIEVEHTRQRVIKVQSSDIATSVDANNIDQLPFNVISLNAEVFKIISWQFHGNSREEILFILEGDGRGN